MRGLGLPPVNPGTRDPVVRFHEGHSPPLLDQMVFHSESSTLVGQVRSSFIRGSWWCFFLVVTSVVLGCVESCWAGDPSFLDLRAFSSIFCFKNIKGTPLRVEIFPYSIIQSPYPASVNSSSFAQTCPITATSLNMSNPHQRPRPCPYSRPVRFAAVQPYPPPPYQPVASHRYGLRPHLPLDVVMASPTFIPAASPAAPVLSPIRAAVNRPNPFSPSLPVNPFLADRGTPGTPPVRPCPSVGGSRVLSNLTRDLTANRVVIDRRESPPPAPRPRNLSSPPSFESSPLAARWSSPSTASAAAGSTTGTPAPARVATPPVQGAYNPDNYHLLQRDQIFLLLAPAPPLAPFNRYRFGSRAGVR
ncbi:hypothetical protein Pst134EA_021219 [Puccinia striiformis f. sp. tritici]|uniref:hypothetical protein n=1 Tax=Puccinia striiformis f. sp. tritici TaxID=168172 RepID=UPI002008E2CF|nr:hypothetical protein Pst134EA_021219 [Puccinia striiformis f. sp. tritici]KAH9457336.1 hypothetical protein Pst134EA_021219 [Puccinia striiformis f. sp. tritici]